MNLIKRIIFFLSCFFCAFVTAQVLPPIQNFSPVAYNAQNQNWAISQSSNKLIYVANNEGLLEFNGASWTLYPSPNETIMRSVTAIDDKIYTGCYMEFGYWQKNKQGILKYTSLSNNLNKELIQDEEFWKIIGLDNYVVFQSLNRIYIYNILDKSFNILDSIDRIVKIYKVEESIYFQKINKGIFKIEKGEGVIFLDHDVLKKEEVINIFSIDNELIFITRDHGIYTYKNERFSTWQNSLSIQLENVSFYDAIKLSNENLILSTIGNGLICIDKYGKVLFKINQSNGLINNTALSIFEDIDNNVWLALDNGISYINIESPFNIYEDERGTLGSVYASAIFGENLYLGTNQGLFFKPFNDKGEFKLIDRMQGQVWSLKVIDNELFCGHHSGTYIIVDDEAKKIADIQGTWNIDKLDENSNLLLQGNYDGLYILERSNNWKLRNKIEGFNNSARHFEVLKDLIFVNHEYNGVFKVKIDSSYTKAINIDIDSSLKGANSGISKYKNEILYAYKKGIFKYNQKEEKFNRDSILSNIYTEDDYISGRIIVDKKDDKFWMFTRSNLTVVSPGKLASLPKIKTVPLTYEERSNVVEYENIINIGNDKYLIGSSLGYAVFDSKKVYINDFMVYLNKIETGINKDHGIANNLIDIEEKINFKNDENNLRISFYTPEYSKYLKPNYQFQLLGIYDEWSDWSKKPSVFFENLPPGEYTFNVRAKIGDKVSNNIATYNFKISKPWYISNAMFAIYGLGIVLFSIFMHNMYKNYYHKEKQKLIEKNKRELELARVQNEKEIIKIKNEKLQKDYKSKSNELAASTMSIVKKNELLIQIKEQLSNINDKDTIKPVINIIDNSLNHKDNWEFFKEAFNNADSEFFKKLKDLHSNLSPNDLKLCAYLRLNLSSKEIAPMFNISPRSVEIKRYRLRKKMNLSSNDNLTNYILSL